jgi:hypothetical protein
MADFDRHALYEAVDAEREARGITWSDLVRELNRVFEGKPSLPFALSTIKGIRDKRAVTSAVILQLLRWLDRPPEDFISDAVPVLGSVALPKIPAAQVLRTESKALHAALDRTRIERGMTWRQVADQRPETQPPMLTNLAKGPLIGFPQLTRITQWMGQPVASFVRGYDR